MTHLLVFLLLGWITTHQYKWLVSSARNFYASMHATISLTHRTICAGVVGGESHTDAIRRWAVENTAMVRIQTT